MEEGGGNRGKLDRILVLRAPREFRFTSWKCTYSQRGVRIFLDGSEYVLIHGDHEEDCLGLSNSSRSFSHKSTTRIE